MNTNPRAIPPADYIIIGAGSAGCAIAARLGAHGKHSILVLEYGGADTSPFIQMPAALSMPMRMHRYDWGYQSAPEPALNNRILATPRGKVIGGSSSINGMIYVRGHAEDFNHWQAQGAHGWGYADVLPYFKRMENWHGDIGEDAGGDAGADAGGDASIFRGKNGPLHITQGARDNPLHHAFTAAAIEAGYAATADYNGFRQEGFGAADRTIWRGKRWSAADAYLKPAIRKYGVRLIKHALAQRIIFESKRAIGVIFTRGRNTFSVRANREIIVAAGAINSPTILQRSGIGGGKILQKAGVDVLCDRAGVGANLQDHLEIYLQMRCLQPITLNAHFGILSKARIGLNWLLRRQGLGTSNHFETLGFIRTDKGIAYPDMQFHFLAAAVRYDGQAAVDGHGFQLHIGPMRSKSRGAVQIRAPESTTPPKIQFNYMSHPDDWLEFRQCVRLAREILHQPAMDAYRGAEIQPGSHATSDDAIDAFIRAHAESAYHPCGTCRMGRADDPQAVVDNECRVIGVENLRVADSSIFPRITNGNLNAPSIMVGEKAADHILGRTPLAPLNLQPHTPKNWHKSQR